jgi:long-subunit fatty acid transport protein
MGRYFGAAAALALSAGAAAAGGIDRSGQGIGIIWEKGNYVELSFGHVAPSVSGTDVLGGPTGDVAKDYSTFALAMRKQINDSLALALILDQPFGGDIEYGATSPMLGGTRVDVQAFAATAILQYRATERISIHGGVRYQVADGEIDLRGLAYGGPPPGGVTGYSVALDRAGGVGYVVGAAYEIPDIALRFAITYNSKIRHEFDTTESIAGLGVIATGVTNVDTPQSVNVDFQTGVAPGWLVFGGARWVDWSELQLAPAAFRAATGGAGLIDLEDTTTYTLGVGHRFSDTWSGSASVSYEPEGDPLVSPLAPTNGRMGVTLAAVYTKGNMKVTTGVNYTMLGDAQPETGTPDVARASMTGNSSIGLGVKVGFTF